MTDYIYDAKTNTFVTIRDKRKKCKPQEDRLLKRLSRHERQRQELMRRLIRLDVLVATV